ncbi:MAG: hypothetical protein FJ148_15620 [Deltaproteobacteria bacterium]|nr:hypothetical protein [Deltaproteobacteria bacterium]
MNVVVPARLRVAPSRVRSRSLAHCICALLAPVLLTAPAAAQTTVPAPDVSGDQLLFLYDARTDRVPFLLVSNPADEAVVVEVAFYPADLSSRLGSAVIELGSAANEIIDPTTFAGGVANGNAGLAVVTPVASAGNLQPIVPPRPLIGGFTLANLALGAGFGQNPFARFAVTGGGQPAAPGSNVDGSSVRYERFTPGVLAIPAYFNPDTLSSPQNDGNRVLLAAFTDQYGVPFDVDPLTTGYTATFFNAGGLKITEQAGQLTGVLPSDLQALAGSANIGGSSGKVFFSVDAGNGNVFGLFAQSVGTFAAGQSMPAVAAVPAGFNGGPVIDCPGGNATISSNVTFSQVWPRSCNVFLDGTIFVEDGVTLTIEAGTTVRGLKFPNNPPPTALIFRRGSQINANGTASQPIVFTSDQPAGQRAAGDWAGLALNGNAPVNCPGGQCEAEGLVNTFFGGGDPNDSSGVVRYVRVEFAGRELSPDNELNVFTMNGVGAGTTVDHVQAHLGLDDGIEWFGGTVNARYLVSSGAADDLFDWQIGYTGAVQFAYGAQFGGNIDTSGSEGFEGDNSEDGFDFQPRSNPKLCNVTLIGAKGQPGGDVTNRGMILRRGTAAKIAQTIVTQFNSTGIEVRDLTTVNNACNAQGQPNGNLLVQNSIFFNLGADGTNFAANHPSTEGGNCQTTDLFSFWQANTGVATSNPGLPASCEDFGCTPIPMGDVSADGSCSSLSPFLANTGYVGAFAPGQAAWTSTPWISFATN